MAGVYRMGPVQPRVLIFIWRVQNIFLVWTEATITSFAIHFKMKTSRGWYTFRQVEASFSRKELDSWLSGLSAEREWAQPCPPVNAAARKGAMFSSFTNNNIAASLESTPEASRFLVRPLVRLSNAPSGGFYLESHQVWGIYVFVWKARAVFPSPIKLPKASPRAYDRFPCLLFPFSSSPRRDKWTVWFPLNVMCPMQMKHNSKMH